MSPLPAAAPPKAADILVIEDDIGMRELLAVHLAQAGYRVRVAADAMAGGRMLLAERPDLLLLDVRMPHMGGDELLALIRADEALKGIKVIVLTMLKSGAVSDQFERMGVSAFLAKPIDKEQLLAAIAKALGT